MDLKADGASSAVKRRRELLSNLLTASQQVPQDVKLGAAPGLDVPKSSASKLEDSESTDRKHKKQRRAFLSVANGSTDPNTLEGLGQYNLLAIRPDDNNDNGPDTIFQDAFDVVNYYIANVLKSRDHTLTDNANKMFDAARCGSLVALYDAVSEWSKWIAYANPDDRIDNAIHILGTRIYAAFERLGILEGRRSRKWSLELIKRLMHEFILNDIGKDEDVNTLVGTLLALGFFVPSDLRILSDQKSLVDNAYMQEKLGQNLETVLYDFQPKSKWLAMRFDFSSYQTLGFRVEGLTELYLPEVFLQPQNLLQGLDRVFMENVDPLFIGGTLANENKVEQKLANSLGLECWNLLPKDLFDSRYAEVLNGPAGRFGLIELISGDDDDVIIDNERAKWRERRLAAQEEAKAHLTEGKHTLKGQSVLDDIVYATNEFKLREAPPLGPKFKRWFFTPNQIVAYHNNVSVIEHYQQLFRHVAAQRIASSNQLALAQPHVSDEIASFLGAGTPLSRVLTSFDICAAL